MEYDSGNTIFQSILEKELAPPTHNSALTGIDAVNLTQSIEGNQNKGFN